MKKTILLTFLVLILSLALVSASDVSINPSNPDSGDDLKCDVSGSGTYDYYWYQDGNQYDSDMNTQSSTLSASNTEVGETWTCKVYVPETGFTDSYYVDADSVTIQDGGDDQYDSGYVEITPEEPYTDDKLTCNVVDSDATFDFYWYDDSNNMIDEDLNREYATLGSSETEEGKTYKCKVYVPETGFTDTYYFGEDHVTVQEDEENGLNPWDLEPELLNFPPYIDEIADIEVEAGQTVHVLARATDLNGDDMTWDWDLGDITDANFPSFFITGIIGQTQDTAGNVEYQKMEWSTDEDDLGYHSVTIEVTDEHGLSDSESFTINVIEATPVNQAPTLNIPDFTISEGDSLWVSAYNYANDPDGDWLNFTIEHDIDGAWNFWGWFYWSTDLDDAGVYEVTATATDGEFTVVDTFTITVLDNNAPVLDPIADWRIDEGEEVHQFANATDVDGDVLTYSWDIGSLDEKGATTRANELYWLTDSLDSGLYSVTVYVTDGEYWDEESFEIKVDNTLEDDDSVPSNYEGHKLEVENIVVKNAAGLASAYEFAEGTEVTVTGDYELNGNVLTSKNTDNTIDVELSLLNKNSFDARDLQITFVLDGERTLTTFPDMDRNEATAQMYRLNIPNNLETGKYALQVIIENDDLYNEEFINLEIESLGDIVGLSSEETQAKKGFWQSFLALF
jgi:hypothetical protein